jgi:outer membrane lipoprotein-sorting protein
MRLYRFLRRGLLAAFVATALPASALALTGEESAVLSEISEKLAATQTMNGEFIQYNPDGKEVQGKFFIARPGKVRFQYDTTNSLSIIADGESVLVHDKQLQTYDIWPLSQTPLRLLLQSDLNLATSDRVTSASVEPDLVQVEMIDDAKFGGGTLTLVFDRASGELRQWTVTDQRGVQTLVTLYNVEIGNRLAADLFKIDYNAATNASREKRLRN